MNCVFLLSRYLLILLFFLRDLALRFIVDRVKTTRVDSSELVCGFTEVCCVKEVVVMPKKKEEMGKK